MVGRLAAGYCQWPNGDAYGREATVFLQPLCMADKAAVVALLDAVYVTWDSVYLLSRH